ncbi:hypothetical protein KIW84_020389 [Lathyrus oleraceus]|uniref:Uncharacterized protein n=1 Tax=Pisum sativum TaxID=3888 RepID=A0A9D4Y9I1_PEA|nr:hypothetical protein KIW84_020389 [Pisum sativum]
MAYVERLVIILQRSDLRENALHVLSKEILSIFPNISMENLTVAQSTRVCNVLALFQCVASHSDTKMLFIEANIPLHLCPFLQTTNKLPQFEHLRLASLGVIGALVKIATFIIQKVLEDDDGLAYICATVERFFAVARVLDTVLKSIEKQHAPRLLKLIISCYSRLSDNHRAGIALTSCLLNVLTNDTFNNYLRLDKLEAPRKRGIEKMETHLKRAPHGINCSRFNKEGHNKATYKLPQPVVPPTQEDPTTWRLVEHLYENIGMNHVPLVPGGE